MLLISLFCTSVQTAYFSNHLPLGKFLSSSLIETRFKHCELPRMVRILTTKNVARILPLVFRVEHMY